MPDEITLKTVLEHIAAIEQRFSGRLGGVETRLGEVETRLGGVGKNRSAGCEPVSAD